MKAVYLERKVKISYNLGEKYITNYYKKVQNSSMFWIEVFYTKILTVHKNS